MLGARGSDLPMMGDCEIPLLQKDSSLYRFGAGKKRFVALAGTIRYQEHLHAYRYILPPEAEDLGLDVLVFFTL